MLIINSRKWPVGPYVAALIGVFICQHAVSRRPVLQPNCCNANTRICPG
uniref:Uncharacterized protein n=1 Tax=Triticum urartu TaxID=4572 RepID=A0A8R7QQC9_TRIUA